MALIDIQVPDIGDFKDVAVIEVLVKPGDSVKAEQSLISVESDKASMEIPSSAAGVVKEIKVAVGDKVNQGSVIVVLEAAGAAAPAAAPAPVAASPAAPVAAAAPAAADSRMLVIKSPMVGTFYKASGPDSPAFVKVGDRIGPEKTVCIIEAMKVFNEIPAGVSGQVVAILVENGAPVEFGQPLIKVETDA
jgi:pyruvate dehydrogenase E2 component (dihydrolipoamide acetyltransferase)